MEPTTVTTIVMIIFGVALIVFGLYNLFGSWQPQVRRLTHEDWVEAEFQVAVRRMREEIRDFERGR